MRICKRCKTNEAEKGSLNCEKCNERNKKHAAKLIAERKAKNLNIPDVSKHLNKVHVIIESKSVDYHGRYNEIVEIYDNIEDAEKKKKKLSEENNNCNIDYFIDTYNVICR